MPIEKEGKKFVYATVFFRGEAKKSGGKSFKGEVKLGQCAWDVPAPRSL